MVGVLYLCSFGQDDFIAYQLFGDEVGLLLQLVQPSPENRHVPAKDTPTEARRMLTCPSARAFVNVAPGIADIPVVWHHPEKAQCRCQAGQTRLWFDRSRFPSACAAATVAERNSGVYWRQADQSAC